MKNRGFLKRLTAATVAGVLFVHNGVLGNAQETNVWGQRRASMARQFAALPAVPRPLQSVLVSNAPSLALSSHGDVFLDSLHASPGRLQSPSPAKGDVSVVHIQDVHLNTEAQANIQSTIENLAAKHAIDLIALEGAFEPVDLSEFRRFPGQDSVARATAHLLKEGRITGPIASAMAGPQVLPPIVGVDDPAAYEANAAAYRNSIPLVPAHRVTLARLNTALSVEKSRTFNAPLLAFDRKAQDFHRGRLTLSAYLPDLSKATSAAHPHITAFLKASMLEVALDFHQVELERARLITVLASQLKDDDYRGLADAASAYRAGTLTHAGFYQRLTEAARRGGISWEKYPAMRTYLRYVAAADAINSDALIEEMETAEAAAYHRLCGGDAERALVEKGRGLALADKLLDFSLSSREWRQYLASGPLYGGPAAPEMGAFEDFYRQAEKRDAAISRNLLAALKRTGARHAVLVAGGFHSSGVHDRLSAAGVRSFTFVPRVTRLDDAAGAHALSVIASEKTPLDRLFDDRTLFLSQRLNPVEIRNRGRILVDAIQAALGRPLRMISGLKPDVRRDARGANVSFPMNGAYAASALSVAVGASDLSGPELVASPGRWSLAALMKAFREETGPRILEGRIPVIVLSALILSGAGLGVVTLAALLWIAGQIRFIERHDNSTAPFRQRIVRAGAVLLFNAIAAVPMIVTGVPVLGLPGLEAGAVVALGLMLSTATHFVWSGLSPPEYQMSIGPDDAPPNPVLGENVADREAQEAFVENRTQRNFNPADVRWDSRRAVFITLATQNGADKLDYWFQRMIQTLDTTVGAELYAEIFVVVNGSTDNTAARVVELMSAYKSRIRVTLIEEKERIGQNGAFNYALVEQRRRYRLAKEKNPELKLYVQLADDDAYFPLDRRFERDHPRELQVSPIESNIRLLEDPELATRIIGHPVKVISANPIAPQIEWNGKIRGIFKYIFQQFTHARRDRYRIALAQVYGANTTLNIEDFPERFPPAISAGDCFLCATFYPLISTNPYAYFEHAEPGDWTTFIVRYVRDLLFHSHLDNFFEDDPGFAERFRAFEKGRKDSHDRLTKMVYAKHHFLSWKGMLHWLNGLVKRVIAFRVARGWLPKVMTDRFRYYRGTNVSNSAGRRATAILNTGKRGFAFLSAGGRVIQTQEERLWEFVIIAMDYDTNLDNELNYDEVLKSISRAESLNEAGRERLSTLLDRIWLNRGIAKEKAMPILDFALALRASFEAKENVPEYFLSHRLFLLYQFAHNRDDWVLAYAAETRLLELINDSPTPTFLKTLFEVMEKSEVACSPVIVRALMDASLKNNVPILMGGRQILVTGALGRTGWKVTDLDKKVTRVVSFTTQGEVGQMAQLNRVLPEYFLRVFNYDKKMGLKMMDFFPNATPFLGFLEADHSLDEWLEVGIEVGKAVTGMHAQGFLHGDLRGPYAMIDRDGDGKLSLHFMNPGAFEWEGQMNEQADIFGLANMIYYGLTKRNAPLPGDYEEVRSVPKNLNMVLRRALGKSTRGEFANMAEFVDALVECRVSLRDNMADAKDALIRLGRRFPAIAPDLKWNDKNWDFEMGPTTFKGLLPSEIDFLIVMLGEGNWAAHRLATFLLIREIRAYPLTAENLLESADLQNIFLPAEVVHEAIAGRIPLNRPIRVGTENYTIQTEFNPRVFLALDNVGQKVILKITDERERDMTREGLDHDLGTPGEKQPRVKNVIAYHKASGIMTLRFLPGDFEEGLDFGTPTFLLSVVESFIEAADRVADLERRGIIHRDIYPANLKRMQNIVQLIDFGLAEHVQPTSQGADVLGLAQELYSILTKTVRWIPRIFGLVTPGGPETPYIATAPGLLNRVIALGIKREISAAKFAKDLRLVRDLLQRDFDPYIQRAFGDKGLTATAEKLASLKALQSGLWGIKIPPNVPMDVASKLKADIEFIRNRVRQDLNGAGQDNVFRAMQIAVDVHDGQWRFGTDNVPYLTHVVEVTRLLLTEYDPIYSLTTVTRDSLSTAVAASLNHDVEEDVLEGTYGKALLAKGTTAEAARRIISERILTNVGLDVAGAVDELSKPPAPAGVTLEEFERGYILSLVDASPEAQLVKMADWHANFNALGVEYLRDAESRAAAARYFGRKIGPILTALPMFKIEAQPKIKFLKFILLMGQFNNEINHVIPGAETLQVMTSDQEIHIRTAIFLLELNVASDLLAEQEARGSRKTGQTWGLWTRWFGMAPGRAVQTVAPVAESGFAALAFAAVFGIIFVAFPGIGDLSRVIVAAMVAQILYALPALTGSFVMAADGNWRLAPATKAVFLEHLAGPGLVFHVPLYLAFMILSPLLGAWSLAVVIPLMVIAFGFGVRYAVNAHAAHNAPAKNRVLDTLRGTPLNLKVDDILPMRRAALAGMPRYDITEALSHLNPEGLSILAFDEDAPDESGKILGVVERTLRENPEARFLVAMNPALRDTAMGVAWAEAATRHPGQLLIDSSSEAGLFVKAGALTGFDMKAMNTRIEGLVSSKWLNGRPGSVHFLSPQNLPLLNGNDLPGDSVLRTALFHFLNDLLTTMTAATGFSTLNFINTEKLVASQA